MPASKFVVMVSDSLKNVTIIIQNQEMDALKSVRLRMTGLVKVDLHMEKIVVPNLKKLI